MLRPVAGTTNEPEADLIVARLAAAGIVAISQRSSGNIELGASGGRTIFVQEEHEQRAREVLGTAEPPFSDDELSALSEQAGLDARSEQAGLDADPERP